MFELSSRFWRHEPLKERVCRDNSREYSYFEKGCRKKCAFANIRPWPLVPFWQISLKNRQLKTTHNTFRDYRVPFVLQSFSKQLYTSSVRPILPECSMETSLMNQSDVVSFLDHVWKFLSISYDRLRPRSYFRWWSIDTGLLLCFFHQDSGPNNGLNSSTTLNILIKDADDLPAEFSPSSYSAEVQENATKVVCCSY